MKHPPPRRPPGPRSLPPSPDRVVTITFADGARDDDLGMLNMISMGGPNGWRMCIGTEVAKDSGPPPSVMSPAVPSPSLSPSPS